MRWSIIKNAIILFSNKNKSPILNKALTGNKTDLHIKTSLIPIIVGVTGHRKLKTDDFSAITAAFRKLDREYPDTPIVVLSPLAEGADRLVARAALGAKRRDGTYPTLICPLPMAIEDYKVDFTSAGSRDEFDLLLRSSASHFILDPGECGKIKDPKKRRRCLYENVGIFVASHSQILLAIWDGKDHPEKQGGTLQIVKMRHEGFLSSGDAMLTEVDPGPIYHFLPRENKDGVTKIVQQRQIFPGMDLYPSDKPVTSEEKEGTQPFRHFLDRLNFLNAELKGIENRSLQAAAENRATVFPNERLNSLNGFSRKILDLHAVVDYLAVDYQYSTSTAFAILFLLAFLALFCFEIYAHAYTDWRVLFLYPAILGLGFLVVKYVRSWNIQSKYLYFRALAESLRVQFFLRLSGNQKIDYPVRGKDELDWLESASRTVSAVMSLAEFEDRSNTFSTARPADRESVELVLNQWVIGQEKYFKKLSTDYGELLKKRHGQITGFFVAGPILAVVLLLLELFIHNETWFKQVHAVFIVAIGSTLALAAIIGGHTGKSAIATKAERSRRMGDLFEKAIRELRRRLEKGENENAAHLIFGLCEIAMEENADWLLDGLEREIEVPKG